MTQPTGICQTLVATMSRPAGLTLATTLTARPGVASIFSILSILGVGCGGGETPVANCPSDLPASCPSPAPGFAVDAFPAIQSRCTGCHSPTGIEANRAYTSYQQIFSQRAAILHQLYACRMPPATAPQPTAEERQALLAWLVCGAPND